MPSTYLFRITHSENSKVNPLSSLYFVYHLYAIQVAPAKSTPEIYLYAEAESPL